MDKRSSPIFPRDDANCKRIFLDISGAVGDKPADIQYTNPIQSQFLNIAIHSLLS